MDSEALLAFCPSSAGFLSEPHKEMKSASERRRGLSSASERNVGEAGVGAAGGISVPFEPAANPLRLLSPCFGANA